MSSFQTRHAAPQPPPCAPQVKLSLNEGQTAPSWVQELLDSGYLTEVHKFSKFIHGTCTLFPELVQAVPYWVDDESVRPSMLASAPPTNKNGPSSSVQVITHEGDEQVGTLGQTWPTHT